MFYILNIRCRAYLHFNHIVVCICRKIVPSMPVKGVGMALIERWSHSPVLLDSVGVLTCLVKLAKVDPETNHRTFDY